MTYQVITHFNETVCQGHFIKCLAWKLLLKPAGWDVRIEAR